VKTLLAAVTVLLSGPLLLAVTVAALIAPLVPPPPSAGPRPGTAVDDIPPGLLPLYAAAADRCPGLSWAVVAAVAKVESDHARFNGATLDANGDLDPPIIGIPLDGTNGTQTIADTDHGRWDADTVWDRAVGPFQFIPTTWRAYGVDGNADGITDPHNFHDAVHAAATYLCANGAARPDLLRDAILAYNHADWYADQVLATAARYARATNKTTTNARRH